MNPQKTADGSRARDDGPLASPDLRERRRALAKERFTAEQRQRVLEVTGQGVSIAVAAKQAGVTA
ncbi:hypothetical protein [Streptomyces cinereoruber]